jgi:alpha-1,2-mannosyltransferase
VNSVLTRARDTRLLVAGAVAFTVILVLYAIYGLIHPSHYTLDPVDLRVYTDGGLIARHAQPQPHYNPASPSPLYDWAGYSADHLKFTYTPFAALVFAIVSLVPWSIAPSISVAVNIIAFGLALWFTFYGLGYRDRRLRLGATLLACAVVFWTEPVLRTIYLGQVNLVLMALILWDMTQPAEGRWWKGAATGVAAGIKLVPIIFVPYLVVTRRFREAIACCAGFLATVVLGFVFLPKDSDNWWFHGLFFQGGRTGFTGWAGNQSLRGLVTRLSGSIAAGNHAWIAADAVVFIGGMAAAMLLDRAGYLLPAILLTSLIGLLMSPISWDHHWVWIAPGIAVAGHYGLTFRDSDRRKALGCFGIAAFILVVFAAWPAGLFEKARNLGEDSLGLIWLPKNTEPAEFVKLGDQKWYVEYHWHGLQLLTGNAFILGGLAVFVVMLIISLRVRAARPDSPELSSEEACVPAPHSAPTT